MIFCLGGTFSYLHDGHKALFDTMISLMHGNDIALIGLTSDKMASKKNHHIPKYSTRKKSIVQLIKDISGEKYIKYKIVPIEDEIANLLTTEIDYLIVSDETFPVTNRINGTRIRYGLKEFVIIVVPMIKDDDGRRLSSTRIANLGVIN
jgi:pantetheine-phosphate adenylyltransferase